MKDKLEVGMYVRFKKGKITYVRKLLEVIHGFETFDVYRTDKEYFDYEEKDYFDIVYPDEVLKPSHDITDLIEVDDIITYIYPSREKSFILRLETLEAVNEIISFIKEQSIILKSIVTKEQFPQMEYRIGE